MAGVIHSDYVTINSQQYPLADGKVKRSRIFSEQGFQVQKDANQPDFGDLNPALRAYEMREFSNGIGLYVDHGKTYSGTVWRSELDHTNSGGVTLPPTFNTISPAGDVIQNAYVYFNGITYALTDNGLFEFNGAMTTLTSVAGTPAIRFTTAQVHRGVLYLGGPAITVRSFTAAGVFAVVANQPGTAGNVTHLLEQDDRLFAVEILVTTGIRVWLTTDGGATAWTTAITTPAAGTAVLSSPSGGNATGACVAPISNVSSRIYVSTVSQVWEVDYTTGTFRPIFDMRTSPNAGNGRVCLYWASLGKLVINQRNTIILIDLETRLAAPVGPEYSQVVNGLPQGLPSNLTVAAGPARQYSYKFSYINAACTDGNYLYISGILPTASWASQHLVVMALSVEGRWTFRARLPNTQDTVHALLVGAASDGATLLVSSDNVASSAGRVDCFKLDKQNFYEMTAPSDMGSLALRLETPWLTCGLPMNSKVAYTMLVDLYGLATTQNVAIYYSLNYAENVTATALGSTLTSVTALPYTLDFGSQDGVAFRAIKFYVYMWDTVATPTTTPVFLGMTLLWRPAPPVRYMYDMNLLIDPELERNGVYTDLDSALDSALEGTTTLSFDPRGDRDATMVRCVPIVDEAAVNSEQERDTDVYHLQLVQVY